MMTPESSPATPSSPAPEAPKGPESLHPAWQKRFSLMDKAGGWNGLKLNAPNTLDGAEMFTVIFNVWGLLFGVFYYIAKGMWKKAFVLFPGAIAVIVLGSLLSETLGWILAICCLIGYACLVNRDYYRLKRDGETMWPLLKPLEKRAVLLPVTFGASIFSLMLLVYAEGTRTPGCASPRVTELVTQIVAKNSGRPESFAEQLRVVGIRTQDRVSYSGALSCAAQVTGPGFFRGIDIQYSVEKTDTFGEIYVTLFAP